MNRLLIVDDETVIADGLYEVFGKFDPELDVVKAYSAFEALDIMKRTRIDIVLSDIRMPGMDGLELMERIVREWPHCKIIFLTGYEDFDCVYKAIQKPGVSYILKTEGYGKVKEKVREAMEEIGEELRMKQVEMESEERLNALETLMQGEYVRHLIRGTRSLDELAADFRQLNIPLDPEKPVIPVLATFRIPAGKESVAGRQQAALAVIRLARAFLKVKVRQMAVPDRYQDVLWLIQPKEDAASDEAAVRHLAGIFEWVERACSDSLGIQPAVTLADGAVPWAALAETYERIRQAQSARAGDGALMVQTVPVRQRQPRTGGGAERFDSRDLLEQAEWLDIHLESGRREEFFAVFDRLADRVAGAADPSAAMACYYAVALVLLGQINRTVPGEKAARPVNLNKLMRLEEHPSRADGFAYLRKTAEWLFSERQSGEQKRAEQVADRMRAFIEEHLHDDLSLVRLADRFHFNPSYLSRMFKQECGVNLSDYLDERRLLKAKELLRDRNLKIAEVGAKVGYHAPHSFTRFFKKMTGLSPQEYRDSRDIRDGRD